MISKKLIIVGGGAAGFFAAIAAKQTNPSLSVLLVEKTAALLSKVRVSGGGRCNVTHSCFDPAALSQNYPRGGRELIGPFHRFQPRDTIEWFRTRGVTLKTEKDGRIFPTTDSSETIIQCLVSEAHKLGVEIGLRKRVESIEKQEDGFQLHLREEPPLLCDALLLATGSSKEGYEWAKSLGHTIHEPIPSLFTFNIPTSPLKELSGIAVPDVKLQIEGFAQTQRGPLLITHFGFSGPAVIKLSAWAARPLYEKSYRATLLVDWVPGYTLEKITHTLRSVKETSPKETLLVANPFALPKNLWREFVKEHSEKKLSDIPHKTLQHLAEKLHRDPYQIEGKTTHKEEFVTCGGVSLKEVDFQTMQSKLCKGLFFAGEILDIDGVTGGFNFQSAWTTGYIAGISITK